MLSGDVRVTFLREPVGHVYSLFLMDKYNCFRESAAFPKNITVWLEGFKGGRAPYPFENAYTAVNLQTHKLSCTNDVDAVDMAQAYTNFDSLFFVGITEHYQASLCLFFAKAHGLHGERPLPHFCDCTDQAAWKTFIGTNQHFGIPPHSISDLSEEDLRMIKELTQLDAKLYEVALRRFRYEAAEVERRTGTKILCED